jgi:hypothetical protein
VNSPPHFDRSSKWRALYRTKQPFLSFVCRACNLSPTQTMFEQYSHTQCQRCTDAKSPCMETSSTSSSEPIQTANPRSSTTIHCIRLGTAQELRTIKRLFQVLGMHAVGYYDLSVAGLPMHGTCFRPIDRKSLEANPFRVFTTLLRPDLLQSDHSKSTADSLLQQRKIFTPLLLQLLDQAEQQDSQRRSQPSAGNISQPPPGLNTQRCARSIPSSPTSPAFGVPTSIISRRGS